jgi:tetratricopeptide (TPR) repeat protein
LKFSIYSSVFVLMAPYVVAASVLLVSTQLCCAQESASGTSVSGSRGMDDEGEPAFQRVVKQASKYGLRSVEYAGALTELGLYYNRCGRYADAARVLGQALQIVDRGAVHPTPPFKEKPPLVEHHPGGVVSATNVNPPTPYEDLLSNLLPALFSAEVESGKYPQAEAHIKRLIAMRSPNDVMQKLNLMQAYSVYAKLLRKTGRTAQANEYEKKADAINKSFKPL